MNNGFLYNAVKIILDNLRHLTLVEWVKRIGLYLWCKNPEETQQRINCRSNIIDGFNIFKWLLIILLLINHVSNSFWTCVVWYFIITNIYSYFYHHIWSDSAIEIDITSSDRARRRFFLLMLAISYSEICFAYLYRLSYVNEFSWSDKATILKSIWYSVSNSFAANYDTVKPISELGNSVSMIQLIITIIFVTIIISKSIPEIKN
ncbi:MAG: hypothetical protein Q8880_10335 [Bacteroidota bacterium]|nr:hypothetical protein [Bacteroidota bacterium]